MMLTLKEKRIGRSPVTLAIITVALLLLIVIGAVICRTAGRTLIRIDIHQNKELILLTNFAEPPQFAIWLENAETHQLKTVFVTSRVSKGDWEGKQNVPVALPKWFDLFRSNKQAREVPADEDYEAVTGATPKDDYFSVQMEVKPGSTWICWIEMNLAGDYNESFPEFDRQSLKEDEFSCGQPALLYRTVVTAAEGKEFKPLLDSQSVWANGKSTTEPVSEGITSAKNIFDEIKISVARPKPKLIEKNISKY